MSKGAWLVVWSLALFSILAVDRWAATASVNRKKERGYPPASVVQYDTNLTDDQLLELAMALGEGWIGAAKGSANYVGLVVSTGVGGGIVLDGQLLNGNDGKSLAGVDSMIPETTKGKAAQ